MITESLSIVADVLLTSLLQGAVGRLRRDPAVRALAEALDESVERAAGEVAGADVRGDVGRLLRQGARDSELATAVPVPDAAGDASRALTEGVRHWVAAVDAPVGLGLDGVAAPTRLQRLGVDAGRLAAALDRHLRAAIAMRAGPGTPLVVVHDRLAAARHHAEDLAGHARTHELLTERAFPAARSSYLRNVERIAPDELLDREPELAELAAFCTEPNHGPYVWWRAGAWAGKSALLAWFTLHPPPRVRVVSFFVTARFAGQGDRAAFADALLEQLAELLDQPMPQYPTEVARDNLVTDLVADVARLCADRGERLVLLVDGLDEDRGVTAGPDVHSIAALLPADPVAGLRVIVAGRPDPPVPFDVPRDHPLRDPAIARELDASSHAHVARDGLIRELRKLLTGTQTERDLLGFLCASGGGLSARDLVELTGLASWDVDGHLGAVSGRTFARRTSSWQPATEFYVLAHEELQLTALEYLGEPTLATYRDRIHPWADGYRDQHWPDTTPEYLLRGYVRMLRATADAPRLAALAVDEARRARLLDVTGGDAAALGEIQSAVDATLESDDPDLSAMARLALARDDIRAGNMEIPSGLPAVWARLGHTRRGEALARGLASPVVRAEAFVALAEVAGAAGDTERAARFAAVAASTARAARALGLRWIKIAVRELAEHDVDQAEELARSWTVLQDRASILLDLAVAKAGDRDRATVLVDDAERLLPSLDAYDQRLLTVAELPAALAAVGRHDRAEQLVWSNDRADDLVSAAFRVARAWWATGEEQRARQLVDRVERMVLLRDRDTERDREVADGLAGELAAVWVSLRRPERAGDVASSIASRAGRDAAASRLAEAWVAAGDYERAEQEAWSIEDAAELRAGALLAVVRGLMAAGEPARASALVDRAEEVALSVEGDHRVRTLCDLAKTLAVLGAHDRAVGFAVETERLARWTARSRILVPHGPVTAEIVVPALATARDREYLEKVLGSITSDDERADALRAAVSTLSAVGEHGWAEELARSIADPYRRAPVLVAVLVAAGFPARAEEAVAAWAVGDPPAEAVALVGDIDRAERLAETMPDRAARVRALVDVANVLAASGEVERAARLVTRAGDLVGPEDEQGTVAVAEALAGVGHVTEAEALVTSIDDSVWQPAGWVRLARATLGVSDRAQELLARVEEGVKAEPGRYGQHGVLLRDLVATLAAAGDPDRAETLARLTGPRTQPGILVSLAAEVDPRRARRLLAEVFATDSWLTPIPALARVDPDLMRTLTDEWLRRAAQASA